VPAVFNLPDNQLYANISIMASLNITISPRAGNKKLTVELDAGKLEKLAANFGFFSDEFLRSIERAENDHKSNRTKKIKSLRQLRK